MNRPIQIISLIVFAILLVFWFVYVRHQPKDKYREQNEMGKTLITIDVCVDQGVDSRKVARKLDDVWQRLRDIYRRMSNFVVDSDVSRINRSYQNPQYVGEDTIFVLNEAIRFERLTQGSFDVTIRPLIDLWKKCQNENRLPSMLEIKTAQSLMGVKYVQILPNQKVQLTHPKTAIDYGGIATGYAVDQAVKMLRKRGFHDFLIDAGGDMYAAGLNCQRKPWRIAIKNPNDTSRILDVIEVSNVAVSTSGNYEQYYVIQNQKYSHIIDPISGYPQNNVVSATMIAPTAIANDVWATALCVLKPHHGQQIVDALGKDYASLVVAYDQTHKQKMYKSKRYQNYQIHKIKDN